MKYRQQNSTSRRRHQNPPRFRHVLCHDETILLAAISLSKKRKKPLRTWNTPKVTGAYKFEQNPPEIEPIIISHGHLDHSAYLSFIKREIPEIPKS
jgi:mRNA degradation ribonuclease J1/J2